VSQWILKIELNGEWEECRFPTRKDALSAFKALAADYKKALKRAILFTPGAALARLARGQRTHSHAQYRVN
jgi:hypothetical protein